MIVKISHINHNMSAQELQQLIDTLPQWRRNIVMKIKHERGQHESAMAYHLLCEALNEYAGISSQPTFIYNEHGKPSLVEHPDIHFNISHCREAVACVVSDKPVGIDIETFGRYKESVARHVMNSQELQMITTSPNPDRAFTHLWTKKEAIVKLLGTGISSDMKNVIPDNPDIITNTTETNNYTYSIASYR